MGAKHLKQSIKDDLLETITKLEDGLDSARSALKTFEAIPSASNNGQSDAIALLYRWSTGWDNGSGLQTVYEDTKRFMNSVAQQHHA